MLQIVPGHLLGRLGQAVSESLSESISESVLSQQGNRKTPLQPVTPALRHCSSLAPGPLGIVSAVNAFVEVTQGTLHRVSCVIACL